MNNDNTTVTLQVPTKDFLHEILGSAFTHWSWWHEETYDEGYDWKTYPTDHDLPFLTLGICDPEDDEEERTITKKVSVNDIAKGFVASEYPRWTDLDAGSSDCIMQAVMFGKVIYA
jgi:hypothetical protein